ncbi:hypothetical protein ACNQVK_02640 [Mycobacterium sp. 134]|uniref:hypothetical protein n=1 Tax=Mycobacteriaceae TaxID=1762 RepID=UPI0011952D5E|nr:hypothetical protein [Mycolicibacterium porcinum]TVX98905.1 hypothetical protein FPV58_19505 [Mycolicibacterium porcinum]
MSVIDAPRTRELDVFMIEDQPHTVKALQQNLQLRAVSVGLATSREFAEPTLKSVKAAAILVDLNIPAGEGGQPDADVGHQLIIDLCEGAFGDTNRETPVFVITAQKIGVTSDSELNRYANFLGYVSKVRSHENIMRKLADLGIVEPRADLDDWARSIQRERVQVIVTDVDTKSVTVSVPDLEYDHVKLKLGAFPPELQKRIRASRKPLALWAIGDIAADTADELQLREFELSDEQVNPERDYTRVEWLFSACD